MSTRPSRFFQFPWRSRKQIAADIDDEMTFHLDMRIAELQMQGLDAAEASRRAREEFGDLEFTRAYCRGIDVRTARAVRGTERLAEWRGHRPCGAP